MSSPIRLNAGDVWEFRGQRLLFQRELGDGLLYFMVERSLSPFQLPGPDGANVAPDTEWLLQSFASGELRRIPALRGPPARRHAQERVDDSEALQKLDEKARLRAFVVRSLDEMGEIPRGDKALNRALARLWAEQPQKVAAFPGRPSARSARRWLDNRGLPGERRLREMMSMSGKGERKRRFPALTLELMRRCALWYWTRRGWGMLDSYARFVQRLEYINKRRLAGPLPLLKRPSAETFRREVRRLECFETFEAKYGVKLAKARFKACGAGLSADRFLRLGCMDHTMLDGFAVIDANWMLPVGRPWLTVLIDVRTRCVVGFLLSFEPPSIYSVMECIKRANRPKPRRRGPAENYLILVNIFGRFDEIVVDNGKEFAGTSLEDAMADVGTSIRFAPVASPTYKAIVERFFGTLNQLLNTKLPGGVLKPDLLREMGYDPSKDAVLTIEELEELIWEALTVYHVSHHSGIDAPPAQVWQRDMNAHGIDVIGDDRQLDKLMGALKHPCRVTTSGVAIFGLQFHDQAKVEGLLEDLVALEPVKNQRKGSATATVKVKYNPANLAEIHVWNQRRKHYVTLPCLDERYTAGMSLWHHRRVQEWAKLKGYEFSTEEQRLLARAHLIERVQSSAPGLKGASRRAIARLMNTPKIQELSGGGAILAHAPARHDGMAPTIEHELLAGTRSDQGQAPTRPARPKRPKAKPRRGRVVAKTLSLPQPETGNEADFSVDLTDWKEIKL